MPVPPAASSGGSSAGKVLLGILIGIVVMVGGCAAYAVILVDSTINTFEQLTVSTLIDDNPRGSVANPLEFGAPHARPPGATGSGWTISVDDVELFEESAGPVCLVVVGHATLDTLRGDRAASAPRSFPKVSLIDETGVAQTPSAVDCESAPQVEGRLRAQQIEVLEGTTVEWYEVFLVADPAFRFVRVEGTVYAR